MAGVAQAPRAAADVVTFDLAKRPLRELNQFLHHGLGTTKKVRVLNPDGAHNIAAGMNVPVEIEVEGHAGYYAAGMNQLATVLIRGNVLRGGVYPLAVAAERVIQAEKKRMSSRPSGARVLYDSKARRRLPYISADRHGTRP